MAYFGHIEKETLENNYFRKVLYTGKHMQLVVMTVDTEIGKEVHGHVDQFFRVEEGTGKFIIDDKEFVANDGDSVIVPAGAEHNVIRVGDKPLKLYTIYTPPNHPEGTIHKNKAEADKAEEEEHHH